MRYLGTGGRAAIADEDSGGVRATFSTIEINVK
jgi:hypothetical protein